MFCSLLYHSILAALPPTQLSAIQQSSTSVNVSWTQDGYTEGYIIYYSGVNSSDIMLEIIYDADQYWHILTGLQNGDTYNLSIVATSPQLPSQPVHLNSTIGLGKWVDIFLPPSLPLILSNSITISFLQFLMCLLLLWKQYQPTAFGFHFIVVIQTLLLKYCMLNIGKMNALIQPVGMHMMVSTLSTKHQILLVYLKLIISEVQLPIVSELLPSMQLVTPKRVI